MCWMDESLKVTWIVSVPILLSLLANLVFLVTIVRVLVAKLRAPTFQMGTTSLPTPPSAAHMSGEPSASSRDGDQANTARVAAVRMANNGGGTRTSTSVVVHPSRSPASLDGLRKAVR